MKKIGYLAFLAIVMAFSTTSVYAEDVNVSMAKDSMITVGYDKSMGEKTIKAAVIDSYFRNVCKTGKIIRWNKSCFPLKVYIDNTSDVPEYYQEIVVNAYQAWQRASEGLVRFTFVDNPQDADTKCYFKQNDRLESIGAHTFTITNNVITDSVILLNPLDKKGSTHDSKQLFSAALQEIGHSLGITGGSQSIYDVMYPIGIKFNTEITPRDLKTLALLYSVIPDITNKPLTDVDKAKLMTVAEVLDTLNVPVNDDTNLEEVVPGELATHLALAEQYRKKAEYLKAAQEYEIVAQMKTDRRSKSEDYYEVAVMYLDAEEFDNAKNCADIAWATDENDLTITLPPLINYYMKRSNSAVSQLEEILQENPYNKHAYKLLCQIYREKHHENLLYSTIKRYGKTAGKVD